MDEPPTGWPSYSETSKGMIVMLLDGYRYLQNKRRGERVYWVCDRRVCSRCFGRGVDDRTGLGVDPTKRWRNAETCTGLSSCRA